jgi:hypothetical protein
VVGVGDRAAEIALFPVSIASGAIAASIFRIEFDGLGEIFDCAVPRARIQARKTSNRPVGGEIVDVVDEAARGEQRDDLHRRLPGGLFV